MQYIYICVYTCIYIYIHTIYTYMYTYIYIHICMCMYTYIYTNTHGYIIYVCVSVCIYIYIYIYIHTCIHLHYMYSFWVGTNNRGRVKIRSWPTHPIETWQWFPGCKPSNIVHQADIDSHQIVILPQEVWVITTSTNCWVFHESPLWFQTYLAVLGAWRDCHVLGFDWSILDVFLQSSKLLQPTGLRMFQDCQNLLELFALQLFMQPRQIPRPENLAVDRQFASWKPWSI